MITAATLNTTQIVHELMGPSMRLYHQDLITHANQPHLRIDKLGAGDFDFVDPTINGSNPIHVYQPDGLYFSVERPLNVIGNMGVSAFIPFKGLSMPAPERFVLTATFQEPRQVSLTANLPVGTYAPVILLNVAGNTMGASSQFRTNGQRLNLPGTNVNPNRPVIADSLYHKVTDPNNPAPFSIVFFVNRSQSSSTGEARLYVEDQLADLFAFTFAVELNAGTVIDKIQVGLGTANGEQYRVSVRLLEFEVWAPTP